MSKKANPTVIGSFVVGAVVLVVVGILVFSSGQFFGSTLNFVLYFEDSLKGLNPGAPVMFRGTKVGTVTDIKVVIDAQDQTIRVPVFMELDDKEVEVINIGPDTLQEPGVAQDREKEFIQKLIEERGLRAQLEMQSLVTGQLLVQLDFFPDTPINLHPGIHDQFPEFPTTQSSLKQFAQKLEDLPLTELLQSAISAVQSLDRFLNDPAIVSIGGEAKGLVMDLRKVVKDVDGKLPGLVTGFDETLRETKGLVKNINSRIGPMAASIQEAAVAARTSLEQAQGTLSTIEGAISEDSPLRFRLTAALKELAAAARSVRDLADYLERHPEAVLKGKN